jgi:hypothetical protein
MAKACRAWALKYSPRAFAFLGALADAFAGGGDEQGDVVAAAVVGVEDARSR